MNKRAKIETPPEEFVDPKLRMKQIRQEVRDYLSGKHGNPWGISHLGELPQTMEDARRVIIALQDMLEEKTQKHNKASTHIKDLLLDVESCHAAVEDISTDAYNETMTLRIQNANLTETAHHYAQQLDQSHRVRIQMANELQTMTQKLFQRDQDVAALKHTIKLTLGA